MPEACRISSYTYVTNGAFEVPIGLAGADCGSSGSIGMHHLLPFFEENWNSLLGKSSEVDCIGSGIGTCKTFELVELEGVTDLDSVYSAFSLSGMKELLVSTGNAVRLSVLIPGIDFLGVELSEIEIVYESLEDCVGFADMFRSLVSLISSS